MGLNNLKAVILCGGKGTRYNRNNKKKILKPLVKVKGKAIIQRIIELYSKKGINNFILLGGYKIETLRKFTKKQLNKYQIKILNTGLNTDTGGRLFLAKKYLNNQVFFFTYGDSLTNFNAKKAINYKKKNNFVMSYYNYKIPYGVLKYKKDDILKNVYEKKFEIPINAGFYILDNKVFNFLKNKNDSFEKKILNLIIKSNFKIKLNKVTEWYPMDNEIDKKIMEKNL